MITAGALLSMNSPLIPSIIAGTGMVYFGWTFYRANKKINEQRKIIQQDIINNSSQVFPKIDYYVACAGGNDASTCEKVSMVDVEKCSFYGKDKKPLDVSLYQCFVVHGDSMKYAGINDADLLFVPKDFQLENLTSFPEILVLEYSKLHHEKARYKVRRTWFKCSINDNLEEKAKKLFSSPKFRKLTDQHGYKGEEWMLKDLKEHRMKDYLQNYSINENIPKEYEDIILSTTYDTSKEEIHFSIHPVLSIVGNVAESFTVIKK